MTRMQPDQGPELDSASGADQNYWLKVLYCNVLFFTPGAQCGWWCGLQGCPGDHEELY